MYCASKFGQVGFTRALDHELPVHGIRCKSVCPGGVATDFALDEGRGRTPDALPGMMAREVALVRGGVGYPVRSRRTSGSARRSRVGR
ncbi:MAG: SDR family NAD(P)-dependent oxidoreductase [Actinomycetes bacterium]